jgi:GNAT superfamily N-acetyltransferase
VWFSEKIESQHERYELPLPAEAVHVGQIDVVRDERGSGVASALLSTGLRYFRDRGFQRSWIIVHPNDVAAMCSIAGVAPSTVLGTVGRVKVLDWVRNRYLELSPPVPVVLSSQ